MAVGDNSSALTVLDRGVLSGQELVARVQRVREVMKDLMEEGVHYGKVPGTQKPSLWKPGAELLLVTFKIGPRLEVEDLATSDEIRYRVKVIGVHQPTGEILAEGIGEASTNEEKYRWRGAVHQNEWEATDPDRRRLKFKSDGSQIQQIRTSPADLANTVLLMAVKRGTVNMTRVVTACSDIFDQDLEDLPEELRQAGSGTTSAAQEKKDVQRASEKSGQKTTPVNGVYTTEALTVKGVRPVEMKSGKNAGKTMYVALLSDKNEYTTYDATLAKEIEKFVGTDQTVRLGYEKNEWQGKTYLNAKSVAVADATPAASSSPAPSQPPLTAGDIPFGR